MALWIPEWGPSIEISNARHAGKGWQNVPGTLDILNWHDPCFTLVCCFKLGSVTHAQLFFSGFLTKVKKILECVCVNCGRLKADTVSGSSPIFHCSFRTLHSKFSGGSLQIPWRTPNLHRCAVLDNRGVLPSAVRAGVLVG